MGWLGQKLGELFGWLWGLLAGLALAVWNAAGALVAAVWSRVRSVWDKLAGLVADVWEAAQGFAYDLVLWLWDWLRPYLLDVLAFVEGWAANNGIEISVAGMQAATADLRQMWALGDWALGLSETLGIAAAGLALCATVRLVRWALSFIWITG